MMAKKLPNTAKSRFIWNRSLKLTRHQITAASGKQAIDFDDFVLKFTTSYAWWYRLMKV